MIFRGSHTTEHARFRGTSRTAILLEELEKFDVPQDVLHLQFTRRKRAF